MLEIGNHTVLVYVKLLFEGKWQRSSGTQAIIYLAEGAERLFVVTEGETGVKTTYSFVVNQGHEVWVLDDVVHIPAICINSAPGDTTKCQG